MRSATFGCSHWILITATLFETKVGGPEGRWLWVIIIPTGKRRPLLIFEIQTLIEIHFITDYTTSGAIRCTTEILTREAVQWHFIY